MLSFPPTFKLGRVENMTAAVNHFVHNLGIITLSQMPWKLILLCLAIIQMRNKFLIDIMMSCYIPDPISHKIFIQETAKMCNWKNYIDIIIFSVNWEKTTIICLYCCTVHLVDSLNITLPTNALIVCHLF